MSNLKVELEGKGPVTLRQSDYKATGGEGSVYQIGGMAIKIYTDPKKMARDGMEGKVKLLRTIQHPAIMAPQGVVKDAKGAPIGLYMPFAEGTALAQIFTTPFRQREGLSDEHAKKIVERMREITQYAHDKQAVMVDPNELGWVVDLTKKSEPQPKIFDVDSWAIGKWGAAAIMPSIRDWHTSGFTALSDWFSWGVVTFQVFTGIHPYQGTLTPYKRGDLEARMKANASVFHQGVKLNAAVRDFNSIPGPLRDWYREAFERGQRSIPPSPYEKGIAATAAPARTLRATASPWGTLIFEKLFELPLEKVSRVYHCGVVLTDKGSLWDLASKRCVFKGVSANVEVVKVANGWLIGDVEVGRTRLRFVDDRSLAMTELPLALNARKLLRYENRLFAVTEEELVELAFMNAGVPLVSVGKRTAVLSPKATQWFDGVGIEDSLGSTFIVVPFGEGACVTVRVRELDGLRPITAKAGNRFVAVVAVDRSGAYQRLELTMSAQYDSYTLARVPVDAAELNMALLPKGVCATIPDDGELRVFVPLNGAVKEVKDSKVATDMALSSWGDIVTYIQDGNVWKLAMR